jgi:hypothetical protein
MNEKRTVRLSTITYLAFSLAMAGLFFVLASLVGNYPPVAKVGGAVWTFFLSLIISMPWVTSYFQKRAGR